MIFSEFSLMEKAIGTAISIVISIASFYIGRWWGRLRAGREWESKTFLDRCIVSLNIFSEGKLLIRTIREHDLKEVFLNQIAIDKVKVAAKLTTKENPILPIPKADRWYILNYVLNSVAAQFAEGHVRRDAGQPVVGVQYALFLTCEQVGDERIRKIRAMLIKKSVLQNFPYQTEMPILENPWHEDRIKTLRTASNLFAQEPDHFLILEICV